MSALGQGPGRSEIDALIREALDRSELGVLARALRGRVDVLEALGLRAAGSHTQNVAAGATVAAAGGSEVFDVGGEYNPVTGLFTAAAAGAYVLLGWAEYQAPGGALRPILSPLVNGAGGPRPLWSGTTSGAANPAGMGFLPVVLAVGDTLSMTLSNPDAVARPFAWRLAVLRGS